MTLAGSVEVTVKSGGLSIISLAWAVIMTILERCNKWQLVCAWEIAYFTAVSLCFPAFGRKISSSYIPFVYLSVTFGIRKVYLASARRGKRIFQDVSQPKPHTRNLCGGIAQRSNCSTLCWRVFSPLWIRLCSLKNVHLPGLMVCLCVHYLCLCTPLGHLSLIS